MSPRIAPPPSPVVEQVGRIRTNINKSWSCLRWATLNTAMAFIFFLELQYGFFLSSFGLRDSVLYYVTLSLLIIFCSNATVDFLRYLRLVFSSDCPEITEKQKRLLAVHDNEFTMKTPPPVRTQRQSMSPVFTLSSFRPASVVPNYSPSSLNRSTTPIMNRSVSPPYYSPHYNTSISPAYKSLSSTSQTYTTPSSPLNRSLSQPNPSPFSNSALSDSFGIESLNISDSGLRNRSRMVSPVKDIMDMRGLDKLLKEEEKREQHRSIVQNDDLMNSFSYNHAQELPQFPYQVACRSPQSVSAHNDDDSNDTFHGEEVWRRQGVSSSTVEVWIERLRRFLSQTIMTRVSREITKLNKQLRRLGLEEMEIGEVSVPTLKQIAITKAQHLHTLNSVIQFLDITSNQQYLVARIHELGKGGCMSDFNWNGGMDYKSKPWAEHLPTDCAIVMHCLCTYLDARLPPHPRYPDGRTFTSQHFLKLPDKPNLTKNNVIIYQTKINPPHFKVIYKDDTWDVPKGRNNMFQSILLFLHFIKTHHDGMLDRVSLGMSGINVLWVLDDV